MLAAGACENAAVRPTLRSFGVSPQASAARDAGERSGQPARHPTLPWCYISHRRLLVAREILGGELTTDFVWQSFEPWEGDQAATRMRELGARARTIGLRWVSHHVLGGRFGSSGVVPVEELVWPLNDVDIVQQANS